MKVDATIPHSDEVWKPISQWEDLYEVSSLGRVRSMRRAGAILRPGVDSNGYLLVLLSDKKTQRRYTVRVHRLVAIAFLKPPTDRLEVNHRNGMKTCNVVSNLEWSSHSENNAHAYKNNLSRISNLSKLDAYKAVNIYTEASSRMASRKEIAAKYNVSITTVGDILMGKTWSRFTKADHP